MNDELITELQEKSNSIGTIYLLEEDEANDIIDRAAERYVSDRTHVWWWEDLLEKPVVINFGEQVGWNYLPKIVQSLDQEVFFIPTDDNPEPWVVFKGKLSAMIDLLEDMWRFEYILIDQDLSWMIFDTHHNCLVVTGQLKTQAMEVASS